ncbi:PDZ domain-containing protein [Priestia flexa]|jgi:PDZ domain|uniref:Cell division protein n=1 Tax=Priestia veravalensis TaxID=1414648 RepID=A0A0V8JKU7_9BACI|nr:MULTISPECIES: PDZ domain-containing protein [Bacillaceae]AQX53244.1 cell division protein [Priestia flexa]KSU87667.1 cell division protein [Priestia veravalensis]KZB91648.1 cell division protein [Bacillus sp. VT 712]MCG7313472.1 PDZ domain-containing protein [Priestia flexa]MCM3065300.1 PDZ domain-containing protein [Priestia flexa]
MEVVIEILKGAGKLFIHPLTYLFLLVSFFVGLARVKRERKNFHVRVFDFILEAKYLFFPGIIIGVILSICTVLVGTYVTIGTLVFVALITFLLSGPWTFRWLSPAYVLGVTIFATLVIPNVGIGDGIVHTWSLELKDANLPSLTFLLALLVVAEGYLIWKFGVKGTSPAIIKSKRGQEIGAHFSQKLWVVPVFLLVPGDAITSTFSWWPVLTVGQTSFSLFFVPFAIGFSQRIQSMLPSASISFTGKRVLFLGVGLVLVALVTLVVPLFSFVVAALAIVVRQWISTKQRLADENAAPFFTKKSEGVIILGIIPGSPAEKMGLQVGELITKVNGVPVSEVAKFYAALQVNNRAFCKLEVLDYSGEVRFAQRALYDNEHHELGILFVHNYKQLTSEAV